MNHPNAISHVRWLRNMAAVVALILVGACSTLRSGVAPNPAFYSLEGAAPAARAVPAMAPAAAPTLMVNPPHASAGFDSQRIIYVQEPHKLEYFAHSEWVDTPSRMLAPLLAAAIEHSAAFRAVVLTPSAAAGDLRLDTEIIRLQHEFLTRPSQVRFTLRAYLVDDRTRRVLAWREFDTAVPAASEDPYGGVVAANRAVQAVLNDLAAFCAETARDQRKAD